MVVGAVLMIWFGRGLTFTGDELIWFVESPDLHLGSAFEPHGGHLTFTSRVVYKAMLEVFGASYLPFRLLTVAAVLLAVGLLYIYAKRRVGSLAALAPCLILLVFGSDPLHSLNGNGFTVVGSLACGIGALLALERDDLPGDLGAFALLCLGVATYTVAIPFAFAAGVYLCLDSRRWTRLWVPILPLALYGAWWVWARDLPGSSESATTLSKLLLIPASSFNALSAALGAISGLDYPFSGADAEAGPTLTLVALAALGWRLARGRVPDRLWAILAVPVAFWSLVGLVANTGGFRSPDDTRYLFPSAVAILLVAAEAARNVRWSRFALIALYLVAAVGVATNVAKLRDGGVDWRSFYATPTKADLAALDIAGSSADPEYIPKGNELGLSDAFSELGQKGEPPTGSYLAAARHYGNVGFSRTQLATQSETVRARVDKGLAAALGLGLVPAGRAAAQGAGCMVVRGAPGADVMIDLPPGGATLEAEGAGGAVALGRFADASIPLGDLLPGAPVQLGIPPDGASRPWQVLTAATPLRACELR